MTLETAVRRIGRVIACNVGCDGGLFVGTRAFAIERGPSGDREMLALLHADDSSGGYWYGHVLRGSPDGRFVALIVWCELLVNAGDVPLLFQRFHYWMRIRLEYEPCSIQSHDDAYAEAPTFDQAVVRLETMIARFDVDKRGPDENGPYASSPPELRIIGVYGLEDHKDADGRYPPVPTRTPLRLVGDRQ
jgi:hypothetical protein